MVMCGFNLISLYIAARRICIRSAEGKKSFAIAILFFLYGEKMEVLYLKALTLQQKSVIKYHFDPKEFNAF